MNDAQKEEKTKKKIHQLEDEIHDAKIEADKFKKRKDEIKAAQGIIRNETSKKLS